MTVSSSTAKVSYSANGTAHSFAYTFKIFADADLTVVVRSATGAETTQTLNTNYIVTNAGNSSGGNVLFKYNTGTSSDAHYSSANHRPANGTTVVIKRVLTKTQTTDYVENDSFPAESHESALDRLTFITQGMQEELDRALKLSVTNTMTSTEFTNSATDRASKILAFDSSGEISVTQELGTYKGTSATTTTAAFVQRDIVKGSTTAQLNNIYICVADAVVGDSLTDTDHFALLVDAVSAATSATNAASSATASASSASTASGHKDTATAQATISTNKAADAGKYAVTAEDSQFTLSDGSTTGYSSLHYAAKAAASATAAASSLSTFTGQYHGSASSDPSSGLNAGDLYFNSSNNVMMVYNGSAWQATTPSSSNQTNINTLAASAVITDMSMLAVSDVIADMALLADSDVIADMNTLATSDIVSDLNTLATSDIVSDLNTLATSANVTNMATLGASGVVANIATVSGAIANVNTTASNISGVNSFAERYRVGSSDPSSSLDEGDLFYNSSSNSLKFYDGSSWNAIPTITIGISNGNILAANAAVSDNDFLRIDGTSVEGRTAAETLSDIGGQAALTFGKSDTNALKLEEAVTTNDILLAGSSHVKGRTYAELTSDLSLDTVKKQGKETMWIPAAAMYPESTNGCAALAQVELSNGPELKCLDFDASSDEHAQFSVAFPKSWNEGTVTFSAYFTVSGTNTGDVSWALSGVSFSDNGDLNTAFGTAVAPTAKAHSGTSGDLNITAESGAVTIAGSPAAEDLCIFQIMRDVSADDQSGDARLLGIKLFFTTDAANDA